MIEESRRSAGDNSGAAPYDFGGKWQPSDVELARRIERNNRNRRNMAIAALSSLIVLGAVNTQTNKQKEIRS